MPYTIPDHEPASFTQGDTVKFTVYHKDFDPVVWTLYFYFTKSVTDPKIAVTGSDNGDGTHLIEIAPAESTAFLAGDYHYQAVVKDGTDEHTVRRGVVTVIASFESTAVDGRSTAKALLDAVEATLAGRASDAQLSMSIANRSISLMSLEELLKARDVLRSEYRRELDASRKDRGLPSQSTIYTRFP